MSEELLKASSYFDAIEDLRSASESIDRACSLISRLSELAVNNGERTIVQNVAKKLQLCLVEIAVYRGDLYYCYDVRIANGEEM